MCFVSAKALISNFAYSLTCLKDIRGSSFISSKAALSVTVEMNATEI